MLSTLDPRPKIILTLCVSTLAVLWRDPVCLAALLGATGAILVFGGIDPRATFTQIGGVLKLVALLFVVQCVFVRSGDPLVSVGDLTLVTVGGATTALGVTLRLLIVVSSALVLLTGDARDYLLALVQCKMPYELAFMVMTAVHFLPILRDQASDVYVAVQMRGVELAKASIPDKLGVYVRIALPIVAGAIRRAEQASLAMEARAFRACPQRTYLRHLSLAPRDVVALTLTPLLTIVALVAGAIL